MDDLYLRVFPPCEEEVLSSADIALVVTLRGKDKACLLQVDSQDNWTMTASEVGIPQARPWEDFERDIPLLLCGEMETNYEYEYIDGGGASCFSKIVGSVVCGIRGLRHAGDVVFFGLRLEFSEDFLLIYPNTDGTAFESRDFKQGRGLEEFETLGKIESIRIG